jgi:hypothetical protein
MTRDEQQILERAVHAVTDQAAKADALVDTAIEVGHGRSDSVVIHAWSLPRWLSALSLLALEFSTYSGP